VSLTIGSGLTCSQRLRSFGEVTALVFFGGATAFVFFGGATALVFFGGATALVFFGGATAPERPPFGEASSQG
jgi:hypothetical protein